MNKINLVVFDLDGTLMDSGQTIFKTTIKTINHLGINGILPWEEFSKKIGAHFKEIFDELNIDVEDLDHFINVYKSFYFDFISDTFVYEGVIDVLKIIKEKGIRIALLTTKAQDQADLIIDHFNLREYFDLVTGRREGLGIKPEAKPLLYICNELKVDVSNTLMVGDSELDIRCGKNAKSLTCGAAYGFRSKEHLENERPDFIINCISDLSAII